MRAGEQAADRLGSGARDDQNTFEKLGIPEAERKFLAGVGAQYESEVVYHSLREEWEKLGVIFLDMDTALREYPEIVKEYFGTIIPAADNKYAALNTAVWSGGSFVYVPARRQGRYSAAGLLPHQRREHGPVRAHADHRSKKAPRCTISRAAPRRCTRTNSLHSAVVEIIVKKGGKCRYTTIQNWSNNIFNLVTKRAVAYEDASMEWVDGNIGSRLTMKYPSVYLMGRGAKGEVLSVAYAGKGQHQDAGAKMVHAAPDTTSRITNKSVSKDGGTHDLSWPGQGAARRDQCQGQRRMRRADPGRSVGLGYDPVHRDRGGSHDAGARGDGRQDRRGAAVLPHEPRAEQAEALSMIVLGFMEPFTRELPMEYAVELNRLIQMEMEGSVG